jgi:hypothetical protein
MSFMTDVVLTMTSVEDTGTSSCPVWPAVDFIKAWIAENYRGGQLFEVASPQGPDGYCPTGVFVGEFQGLDREGFVEAVQSAPWQWPEKVRLFIRDERSEVFELVAL